MNAQEKEEYKRIYTGNNEEPKEILSRIDANELIYKGILSGEPFWVGRWGQTEMNLVSAFYEHECYWYMNRKKNALRQFCNNAGFFPQDMRLAERYVHETLECYGHMDIEGYWKLHMHEFFRNNYASNVRYTTLNSLEPFCMYKEPEYKGHPWSYALKDKKVLVIHPFSESIKSQYYENRDNIFSKCFAAGEILPEFELKTITAVQTIAGNRDPRFKDWYEALDWMKGEIDKADFDIAIIGCGAYGFLLAAYVKEIGKAAVHLGGATQLLFGVLGDRWTHNDDFMNNVVNEFWIRPIERTNNLDMVENGCYW